MTKLLSNILGLGLLAGLIGLAVYYFAFGQTFEGEIQISAVNEEAGLIGVVTFQSRFKNRRFLTHSMSLDYAPDTPTTYKGEEITAKEAVRLFTSSMMDARVRYREEKSGWGYVISLDIEPAGTSTKEMILFTSLLLIFGCTVGMAVIARSD